MVACPACESGRISPWHEKPDWRVLKCKNCGYGWAAIGSDTKSVASFQWARDILVESQKRVVMYRDRIRRIEAYRPKPKSWLDIGCGGGGLLRCAMDVGWQVEGVEPGPAADIVAAELRIRVHKSDLAGARSNLDSDGYGVVSYFHVLEHVPDPNAELLLAREVCAQDGLLVLEVPLFDALAWRILGTRHRHFGRMHRSYFTRKAVSTFLSRSGFSVVECRRVPYFCSIGWLLTRLRVPAAVRVKLPVPVLDRPVRIDLADVLLVIAEKNGPAR